MAKRNQAIEAKETPPPWKILERNQRLRDGREVVDIAGDTSKSPENWEIVATKMLVPDAQRLIALAHACSGIATESLTEGCIARFVEDVRLKGGGDIYLESFGRYCFCSGCFIAERGPVDKGIHSSNCEDLNAHLQRFAAVRAEPAALTYRFNDLEAKGEIKFERGPYGVYVHVNGQLLAMIDLFYLSPEWKSCAAASEEAHEAEDHSKQGTDSPQIDLYMGDKYDSPIARVRWGDGKVIIESDMPSAMTEAVHGPGEVIQRLTVGEDSEPCR